MDFVGLLEVMDMPHDRWPGLERMEIDILDRAEVWPADDAPASSAPAARTPQTA